MINQAQWINGWYYKATLTYPQFIQLREYERSFRYSIDEQTKNLIANETDLAEAHISTLREQNTILAEINATVSTKLDEINGTLNWGFTEVIAGIGRVNDQLADLVKLARTPAQTWAYEQYDIARDAYRKGLFAEALRYLERAINGAAGNAGYDLDFRFHFLKGLIYLGSYKNADPAIVSTSAAEASFLMAGRYSQTDFPQDAARSFLLAGRAAYCNRQLDRALQHTTQSISLHQQPIAEAFFQRAKIQCASDQCTDSACADVLAAIRLDRVYGLKIGSDGDLTPYTGIIMQRIDEERRTLNGVVAKERDSILLCLGKRRSVCVSGRSYMDTEQIKTGISRANEKIHTGTYYSLLDAGELLQEVRAGCASAWREYQSGVMSDINAAETSTREQLSRISLVNGPAFLSGVGVGTIGGIVLAGVLAGTGVSNGTILTVWGLFFLACMLPTFCVNRIRRNHYAKSMAQLAIARSDAAKLFAGMAMDETKMSRSVAAAPPRHLPPHNADVMREVQRLARTSKIDAIKHLRAMTGIGLKDAKDFVESLV